MAIFYTIHACQRLFSHALTPPLPLLRGRAPPRPAPGACSAAQRKPYAAAKASSSLFLAALTGSAKASSSAFFSA